MSSDYTGATIVGVGVAKQTVSIFSQRSVCACVLVSERLLGAADAALRRAQLNDSQQTRATPQYECKYLSNEVTEALFLSLFSLCSGETSS